MKSLFFLFLFFGGEPTPKSGEPVKVFLDCGACDMMYIRQNLPVLSYVRDVREAQVFVMVRSQATGADGNLFTFIFEGMGDMVGKVDTLTLTTAPDATQDEVRKSIIKTLTTGLIPYIAKTDMIERISFQIEKREDGESSNGNPVSDQWNAWIFEIGLRGNFNGDDNYRS